MSIADYANYIRRRDTPLEYIYGSNNALTVVAGRLYSGWTQAPNAGVAPTTAAVPTNATAGAIPFTATASARILAAQAWTLNQGSIIIYDRLSHQGGLSGTTAATAQTTNLPTAALTRYTSGEGVMAFLEVYTAVGATGTTAIASYTNQAGTSGQTTLATAFGATGFNAAGRMVLLPLAVGDSGVQAVASVTLTATTGTAGNFGVTLAKPLFSIPLRDNTQQSSIENLFSMGFIPEFGTNACLMRGYIMVSASTGVVHDTFTIAED